MRCTKKLRTRPTNRFSKRGEREDRRDTRPFTKRKTPARVSQDDVNYYEYMEGDGFAKNLKVKDGKIVNAMVGKPDGAYDLVPIVDAFVQSHPDFSYKGAKGLLGITGYNGVLGYRSSYNQYGHNKRSKRHENKRNRPPSH